MSRDEIGIDPGAWDAGRLAAVIDHTLLDPDAPRERFATLCREAGHWGWASISVPPGWVSFCASELEGAPVAIGTLVGEAPAGASTEEKVSQTQVALIDGASEIDMVLDIEGLRAGRGEEVAADVEAVVAASAGAAVVKVTIESSTLSDEEKIEACLIAEQAGARYVKTSTGPDPRPARADDVQLLRGTLDPSVGVEACGGIENLETALAMIQAGADRIGTSRGVAIIRAAAAR